MRVVYILALAYILLFFPQFLSIYAIFDSKAKKVYFSFYLFSIVVLGGYIKFYHKKLYIHIGKRVKIVNYNDYLCGKKSIEGIKLEFYRTKSVCILGAKNSMNLYLGGLLFSLNEQICTIVKAKKPFIKIKNDLAFTNDEDIKIAIQINCFTNLLDVILLAFKNIIEELKNARSKRE